MKRTILLGLVLVFLFSTEVLSVYFIMPFPGSQRSDTIQYAYFINHYSWWLRLAGWIVLVPLLLHVFRRGNNWKKTVLVLFLILYGVVFYFVNFRFLADKMFYQPRNKLMASVAGNQVDTSKLVIGISINGQAKAYPIEIIGYHHQVQDTVGGEPVMVTYCTVCRTGRVYSPFVNGKFQHFRLVGMDHFNAMFEDGDTKSWWRQATGTAVAGPMKGKALKELPSEQMRLGAWVRQHPGTMILQPDPAFVKQYSNLRGFDAGTIPGSLERRDTASWKFKSWVVGVVVNGQARAYDWNNLVRQRTINDTLNGKAILLVIEKDKASFHCWSRELKGQVLQFSLDEVSQTLKDASTNSAWDMDGVCNEGAYSGSRLAILPAYQEFWHSWQSFHPGTGTYKNQ